MSELEQYRVRAADGAIWSVTDVLLDDTSWTVRYLDSLTKSASG